MIERELFHFKLNKYQSLHMLLQVCTHWKLGFPTPHPLRHQLHIQPLRPADGVSRLQIDAALPSNPSATSFPAVGLLDQPHTEPTFLDLLATVPHLLHCYFQHSWHNNKVYGIRHLRRVSKEAGRIALTAVETCSILVGHRSWLLLPMYPAQQSLVRLMKTAQLQKLCLAMRTTTGEPQRSDSWRLQ